MNSARNGHKVTARREPGGNAAPGSRLACILGKPRCFTQRCHRHSAGAGCNPCPSRGGDRQARCRDCPARQAERSRPSAHDCAGHWGHDKDGRAIVATPSDHRCQQRDHQTPCPCQRQTGDMAGWNEPFGATKCLRARGFDLDPTCEHHTGPRHLPRRTRGRIHVSTRQRVKAAQIPLAHGAVIHVAQIDRRAAVGLWRPSVIHPSCFPVMAL